MYEVKGRPTKIAYTSRTAIKVRDNYCTVEATEERSIDIQDDVDMQEEFKALCDEVNEVVDIQAEQAVKAFLQNKKQLQFIFAGSIIQSTS